MYWQWVQLSSSSSSYYYYYYYWSMECLGFWAERSLKGHLFLHARTHAHAHAHMNTPHSHLHALQRTLGILGSLQKPEEKRCLLFHVWSSLLSHYSHFLLNLTFILHSALNWLGCVLWAFFLTGSSKIPPVLEGKNHIKSGMSLKNDVDDGEWMDCYWQKLGCFVGTAINSTKW